MLNLSIANVTTGLTLLAFLALVVLTGFRYYVKHKESLILAAKPAERADLVKAALVHFRIDPSTLTKQQQFDLAMEQIKSRDRRYLIQARSISVFFALFLAMAAYAIWSAKADAIPAAQPRRAAATSQAPGAVQEAHTGTEGHASNDVDSTGKPVRQTATGGDKSNVSNKAVVK